MLLVYAALSDTVADGVEGDDTSRGKVRRQQMEFSAPAMPATLADLFGGIDRGTFTLEEACFVFAILYQNGNKMKPSKIFP